MSNRCKVCDHRAVNHGYYGCNHSMPLIGQAAGKKTVLYCPCLLGKAEIRAGRDRELSEGTP